MERFYQSLEAVDNSYDDSNLPLFQDNSRKSSKTGVSPTKLIENVFHVHVEIDKKYIRQSCSEQKDSMPYLSGFFTGWYSDASRCIVCSIFGWDTAFEIYSNPELLFVSFRACIEFHPGV